MNYLLLVLALFAVFVSSLGYNYDGDDYDDTDESPATVWKKPASSKTSRTDVCVPVPLGGIEWILSKRQSDYGWKEDTHRAVIALAINGWGASTPGEIRQMELQLEVELTKALLQNSTSTMYPNDLALYINALIATRRNPHNFYGIDLVSRLEKIVEASHHKVHPFLLLALCNADRLTEHHFHRASTTLQRFKTSNDMEYLALALNAYECAGSRGHQVDDTLISEVRKKLIAQQHADGSFGNVYTTSLVVQALASTHWSNKQSARVYLKNRSTIDVNMVSSYLIQLALIAEKIHFIKDLHPELELGPATVQNRDNDPFIQYTLRVGRRPDVYFTISIKVSPNVTFFDVMKLSAQQDSKFNFSHYLDKEDKPVIYSISGVPNDAEENLYWRLCLQTDVNHDRHDYNMRTINYSPSLLFPKRDEHVLYWYKDTDCEVM